MTDEKEVVSEETVAKVLSMLPDRPTVEQLMETRQFDGENTIHAALSVLAQRGKVQSLDLLGYGGTWAVEKDSLKGRAGRQP